MTDTEIGFAQLGLASILKHNQLVVPPNQRDYSWTVKEVRTLLQDFAKAISEGDGSYFLGTIVTIPRPGNLLEVVDGQQRLATTAIILSAIRDYLRTRDPMIADMLIRLRPTHTSRLAYAVYTVASHKLRAYKKGVGRLAAR